MTKTSSIIGRVFFPLLTLLVLALMPALEANASISPGRTKTSFKRKLDPNQPKLRLLKQFGKKDQVSFPLPDTKIVIEKSRRVLKLYSAGKLVKSFHVALGQNSAGAKERQGDLKTPEGTYYIANRNDASQFHLFLGLNYPNIDVAEHAYQQKKIPKTLRDQILLCQKTKRQPPWNSALGGAVGIHGYGKRYEPKNPKNWTSGCIALRNTDIEELWIATNYWTPVLIKK